MQNPSHHTMNNIKQSDTTIIGSLMRQCKLAALGIPMLFLLAGCGEPPKNEIKQALVDKLPSYFIITQFDVANRARKTDKYDNTVHFTLFKAEIKVEEATYKKDKEDKEGTVVIIPVHKAGDTMFIRGKAASLKEGKTWNTDIDLEDFYLTAQGQTLGAFASKRIIIKGTQEELVYLEEQREIERKTQEARKQALEVQRQELEAREKEMKKMITQMAELLPGRWRYVSPDGHKSIIEYKLDGTYRVTNENGYSENGTWSVDKDFRLYTVICTKVREQTYPATKENFNILSIAQDRFVIKSTTGKYPEVVLTRVK